MHIHGRQDVMRALLYDVWEETTCAVSSASVFLFFIKQHSFDVPVYNIPNLLSFNLFHCIDGIISMVIYMLPYIDIGAWGSTTR